MDEPRIGEILLELLLLVGKIDVILIEKLRAVVDKTNMPVQKMIRLCNVLSDEHLKSALAASVMVRTKELTLTKAAILLAKCFCTRTSFDQLIRSFNYSSTNALSMALIMSGFLETSLVDSLAAQCARRQIDGYELWQNGIISLEQWKNTLEQLVELKNRTRSSREILFDGLICRQEEDADTEEGSVGPLPLRIGDLLVGANVIKETDFLRALESGLDTDEKIGSLLVRREIVSQTTVDTALRILELTRMDLLLPGDAVSLLKEYTSKTGGRPQRRAIGASSNKQLLLKIA